MQERHVAVEFLILLPRLLYHMLIIALLKLQFYFFITLNIILLNDTRRRRVLPFRVHKMYEILKYYYITCYLKAAAPLLTALEG
jgi:hypothetical protein